MTDFSWEPPASLVPWARNPRKKQPVARVAASIQRFGFGAPVVARPSDRRILAGHTRVLAALELKLETVPVRWLELADAEADAMSLADNRIGEFAEWDERELAELLEQLRVAEPDIAAIAGFDDTDVSRLLASMRTNDGGGASLVAAERLGLTCIGAEIDRERAAAAMAYWEEISGERGSLF